MRQTKLVRSPLSIFLPIGIAVATLVCAPATLCAQIQSESVSNIAALDLPEAPGAGQTTDGSSQNSTDQKQGTVQKPQSDRDAAADELKKEEHQRIAGI